MASPHHPVTDVTKAFDPVAVMQLYHAAIETRDLNLVASFLIEDAEYQSKGLGPVKGRSAIVAAMENYFERFRDHKAWDTRIEEKYPHIAFSEWQLRATDSKTGERISRHGTERVFFNKVGMIVAVLVEDLT